MSEPHHGPRLQRTLRMPCDAFHMILSQIQCYIVWLILHDWANMSEQVDLISLWASHLASATCHVVNRGKAFCQEGEEEALYKLKEARDAMAVIWSSFCHCFRNQPNQSLKLWAVSKWEKEPSLNCYNMQVHANRKVAPPPKKWVGVLESQKAAVFNVQKNRSKSSISIQFYPFLMSTNNRKRFAWSGRNCRLQGDERVNESGAARICVGFFLVQRFPCTAKWLWLGWNRLSTAEL